MTTLTFRDPFLAAPFRLVDELLRAGGNGGRRTGFTPLLDVRETGEEYIADYTDGVLTLHIPKPTDAKPKRIAIGTGPQKQITSS